MSLKSTRFKQIRFHLFLCSTLLLSSHLFGQQKRSLKYYNHLALEIKSCPENLDSVKTYFNAYFKKQFVKNADFYHSSSFQLSHRHLEPLRLLDTDLIFLPLPAPDSTEEYPFTDHVSISTNNSLYRLGSVPREALGYMKFAQEFYRYRKGGLFAEYAFRVINDGKAFEKDELFRKQLESGYFDQIHAELPDEDYGPSASKLSKKAMVDMLNSFAQTSFNEEIRYDKLVDTLESITGLSEAELLDTLFFQEQKGKYLRLEQLFTKEKFNQMRSQITFETEIQKLPFQLAVPHFMLDSLESFDLPQVSDDSLLYFKIRKVFLKVKPGYNDYYVTMSLLGRFSAHLYDEALEEEFYNIPLKDFALFHVIFDEDLTRTYYKRGIKGSKYQKLYSQPTFVR